ncbi:MAG TPA: putative Ig domain-containing protein [Luteimonas sp.]|nr:putative Ig domain-containing protein [Luteimonas sp.]
MKRIVLGILFGWLALSAVAQAQTGITISPCCLQDGFVDEPYSETFTASGGSAPYTFTIVTGALPPGLTLETTGELHGTPTTTGAFGFLVGATDALGISATRNYSMDVLLPPTIDPPVLPDAVVGELYAQQLEVLNPLGTYDFSVAGTLPPGLTLTTAGLLRGTPTTFGSYSFTVIATEIAAVEGVSTGAMAKAAVAPPAVTANYTLLVAPVITLSPPTLPDGNVGTAYAEDLFAGGGTPPYNIHLVSGTLPPGLTIITLGPDQARLDGTPTTPGNYAFDLGAMDANGFFVINPYDVSIAAPTITVSPSSVPPATVHADYNVVFSASGGTAPYTFTIDTPPPGLTLAPDGTLAGTPASEGSFAFDIIATDALGSTGSRAYALDVGPPLIAVSPASLPDGSVGTPYNAVVSASGGLAPYTFENIGDLPDGLSLDALSGVLSGTPTAEGSFSFSVQASDADGHSAVQAYLVMISDNAPVAVDDSASTLAQQAVSIDITANDSGDIDAVEILEPPAHGSASVDGLLVVYTPAGTFFGDDSFQYTASGPGGVSAPATVTVHVAPLPVPVGVPQALQVLAGDSVTFDAADGASGGPITGVAIVQPPAIGSASVAGTLVTYVAPADGSGVQQVGYVLSNAFGDSAPVVSTIAIDAAPVVPDLHATTPMGIAVELDLTSGASGGPFVGAAILGVTPSGAGTAMLLDDGDGSFRLRFTPGDAFVGDASVGFTLSNAEATSAPATAVISVTERDDPTRNPEVGGIIQAQVFTVREFVQAQINNVHNRLEELHDFEPGDRPWGFWIGGNLRHGDRDGNGAVAPASFETSGLTSGADYRFSERFAFGAALGHGRDRTAIGNEGSRSDGRAESATGYGSFKPSSLPFYVDGMAGHQRITFQLQRVDPATGEVMSVPRDGVQSYSSWASGYEHKADTWMIGTYGRMDVSQARLDAYEEQGSPLQALAFEEMAIQTRVSTLGVRGRFRHKIRWGTLEPKFRIEFQRDFHDATGAVIRYADQAGGNQAYVLPGSGLDRNRAIIELGGVLRTFGGMVLRLELRSIRGGPNDSDNAISFSFQDDH